MFDNVYDLIPPSRTFTTIEATHFIQLDLPPRQNILTPWLP